MFSIIHSKIKVKGKNGKITNDMMNGTLNKNVEFILQQIYNGKIGIIYIYVKFGETFFVKV
jgi:hypothetical protein